MHGGKSTGPKDTEAMQGNKRAVTHGFYARALREDEPEVWSDIPVDSVDDEIRLLKVQIRRLMIEMGLVWDDPDNETIGFRLAEIKNKRIEFSQRKTADPPDYDADEDDIEAWEEEEEASDTLKITIEGHTVKKRPDYLEIFNRMLGRLAQLMQAKHQTRDLGGGRTPEEIAREVQAALDEIDTLTVVDTSDGNTNSEMDTP